MNTITIDIDVSIERLGVGWMIWRTIDVDMVLNVLTDVTLVATVMVGLTTVLMLAIP